MKVTLSVIKADIGSIGGHMAPSRHLLDIVKGEVAQLSCDLDLVIDHCVSFTGDGIAILLTHTRGIGDPAVHGLAWDAFAAGTREAQAEGLYGAGQDLPKDAFSGNVKDSGPAVAEMEIEERDNEPLLMFAADKTDPGAFNLPLYLAFADPMNTPGLILSPKLARGFRFVVMDVKHAHGDRVIELDAPEQLYEIAALLRDAERFVVESVWTRSTKEQAVAVATSRPRNAGKHTGKDDPVMLVRTQMNFPATGEILAPYATAHFVAGGMRGSHNMPLMPVALNTGTSYFDGPPLVSCAAFAVHRGKLTEPLDCFAHPFWNSVRARAAEKGMEMRKQGFFGAAMLPLGEIEYTGIAETLERLKPRFRPRDEKHAARAGNPLGDR